MGVLVQQYRKISYLTKNEKQEKEKLKSEITNETKTHASRYIAFQ